MNRISRVLVAVDFSEPAYDAFEYALALSTRHRAELVLVQAVPPDQRFRWHARERRALTARLRRQAERSQIAFSDRIQRGDPAEIILLHARALRPDVIVLGTQQRRGIERLRIGSVAERVMANATMPVFVVPQGVDGTIKPFSHVAVVDSGAGTKRLIEQAMALSSAPPDITVLDDGSRSAMSAVEINRAVAESGADLLVVGVPKRSVISRALFGTAAARLLRVVRIPMFAIPEVGTAGESRDSTPFQLAA